MSRDGAPNTRICPNCGYPYVTGMICPVCRSVGNWYVIELIVTVGVVFLLFWGGFGSGYYYKEWTNGDAIITYTPTSNPQSSDPLSPSSSGGDRNPAVSGISVLIIWLSFPWLWVIVACALLVITYTFFRTTRVTDIGHLLAVVERNRWMLICLFATILFISLAVPSTRTQIVRQLATLWVAITPWFTIYRQWVVIILLALVVIVLGRTILLSVTRPAVVSTEASQHPTIRGPALVLKPEYRDFLHWDSSEVIEKLDLGGHQKKLAGRVRNARGIRYIVTGYGRFGGTVLIRGVINKLTESKERRSIFYFEAIGNVAGNNEFSTRFTLKYEEAVRSKKATFEGLLIGELEIRQAGDRGSECIFKCKCQKLPSQLRNLFAHKRGTGDLENVFDFRMLIGGFQRLSPDAKPRNRILTQWRRVWRTPPSSGAIVVIDKVSRIEVLEALCEGHLFRNRSLTVIVLARKEEVDQWQNCAQRLKMTGFEEWFIPRSAFNSTPDEVKKVISEIMQVFFEHLEIDSHEAQHDYKELSEHLEFVGKGELGSVIEHLKKGIYLESDDQNTQYILLKQLPNRQEIRHTARLQHILDRYMNLICPNELFYTTDRIKRSHRGIYLILEFMYNRHKAGKSLTFSTDELLEQVSQQPIIWNDPEISLEIVWNLLEVLRRSGDLEYVDTHSFRMIWSGNAEIPEMQRIAKPIPPEWKERFKVIEKRNKKPTLCEEPGTQGETGQLDSKGQENEQVQKDEPEVKPPPQRAEPPYAGPIRHEFDNTVVEIVVNVLTRAKVTLAGLIDLLFLALWLISTYGFSRYVLPLLQQTGTMDQWMFNLMQIVFNGGTLFAVFQFVVSDILVLVGRTYKQIREIREASTGVNNTHDA